MSRYRFTNLKNGAFTTGNQDTYDAIAKRKWLGRFKIEILENGPSMPITSSTFLPPEIQKLRATKAEVQPEVADQTKEATEQANQPVPNLDIPATPAVPNPAPATGNKTGPRKAQAEAGK